LRVLLGIAASGYSAVITLRNLLYSKKWLKTHQANATVISIGNITAGGTGKTPLVIWLCNFLGKKNICCAILTRGYKMEKPALSDEPAILTESCPDTKVIVNPDRVAAAAKAIEESAAKVLIMDDGFQHRRLARDLDIVTIDATGPFGYEKLLPAGLLREPLDSLKRAHTVVITRCDQVSEVDLTRVEEKLLGINQDLLITRSIHAPVCAKSLEHMEISLDELKGKKIFAFCGIGNPEAFLTTVRSFGVTLVGSKIYDDHYHYTNDCLTDIQKQACSLNADLILTTQKDWTKATPLLHQTTTPFPSDIPSAKKDITFAYLAIELKFLSGEDKITQLIEDTLAGKIPGK